MKILQVENIANVPYNLSKGLRARGYDVILITRREEAKWDQASRSNENWIELFNGEGFYGKTVRYLIKILSKKPDIIHCHYALHQGFYGLISKKLGRAKKLIIHAHGTDLRERIYDRKYSWIVKKNINYADIVLVSTPDLLLRKDFIFFPNPINDELFKPTKATIDLKKGHVSSIFCPSRQVWHQKGQDTFLHALKILIDEGYDILLTMISYGIDYPKSKYLVNKLGLNDHVHFVDPISPHIMSTYYNSCDLVWSQFGLGTFGLVTLESMACNKITLTDLKIHAYDSPPPIINVANKEEIVEFTEKALDGQIKIYDKPRRWVLKNHGYSNTLDRLEKIYSDLFI